MALAACDDEHAVAAGAASGLPSAAVEVNPAITAPGPAPRTRPVPVAGAPQGFAELVSKADPAVVFVRTRVSRSRQGPIGSAFVYDPGGLILTNNHVIEGAEHIQVVLGRDREMTAELVGADPPTDLAVLRVEGDGNLPYLPLGDSDATRVGDWVVAIGNPFELSHSVSAGILSGKGRTLQDLKAEGTGYYNFLQTDASINQGNSGGPLLDMSGHVVGINTAIRQGANSIGFAIPINMVKELLPSLVKHGKVRRSAMGLDVASLLPHDIDRLELDTREGVLVRRVVPGGPADRAGLKPDDVLLSFEGAEIGGPEKLRWLVSVAGVGEEVELRVRRGTRTFDLKVRLGQLADSKER